jgi:predicted SAM-dependent methyltransferase
VSLRSELLRAGRRRWLDLGCGGRFDDGFDYVDIFPEGLVPDGLRHRYRRLDVSQATPETLPNVPPYDLVRLQHTLEHVGFEDGARMLANCGRLLAPGGYLLVSVPDLRIHLRRYMNDSYAQDPWYQAWAWQRIPRDAPASAYFSVFAHSMTYEPHRWCYDYAGLAYQVNRCGCFEQVRELCLDDPLAEVPFTHNRPDEDVCLLAVKR